MEQETRELRFLVGPPTARRLLVDSFEQRVRENLFWGSGHDWKPSDAVKAWATESCYYNHKTNSCDQKKDCLHYTQMVWKQSSKIGCAKVICKSRDTIFACVYDPPGNVIGQKPF